MASAYEHELEAERPPFALLDARSPTSCAAVDKDQLDRIVLCTSEIVTNAIEHGAPPIELGSPTRRHGSSRGRRHVAIAPSRVSARRPASAAGAC